MSKVVGRVFNIQKFSIHDGPGIRTVVFLKGCPMSCPWCSNPNSIVLRPVMMKQTRNPEILVEDSSEYTVDEVLKICLQDVAFYEESGGGVTLSGGEVLVQHRFAFEVLTALREHRVHTAIETTGYAAPKIFQKILSQLDLLIIDVKHHNVDDHREWTGMPNTLPLQNLEFAIKSGRRTLVRIPVIPGVNNSVSDAVSFAKLLKSIGVEEVQLLPFHQFGEQKYKMLDWKYRFEGVPALHEDDLFEFQQVFEKFDVCAYF